MVTPEIVDPMDAKDPKPSPVMPAEFLENLPADTTMRFDGKMKQKP